MPFDCGDPDLNEFLLSDSKNYYGQLLAVTYLLQNEEGVIAFFSVLNDKISVEDVDTKSRWKRIRAKMPRNKQFKSYPAVKIGRFAVCNSYKGKKLGTALLDYIKYLFIDNNRTGCRFITVDAYSQSLNFYEKNGFKYLTESDKGADTRLMHFDLSLLKTG
jgi:GNAT superfamily N-acetyltransferase